MMNHAKELQNRLQQKEILLMDGAMGTEILRRGVSTTLPLWSSEALLTHPDVVQQVHADYIRSGAEIIITNTFRTTKRAFAKKAIETQAHNMAILACQLAQQAIQQAHVNRPVYIAGSMAPLEDCYSPELTPANEDLRQEHYAYAQDLKTGGVDFLLMETMITLRETLAAVQAAKKLDMPFAVSFCTNAQGNLLGGDLLKQVVQEIERYDPLFIGVNCISPEQATLALQILKKGTARPLSVYAQGEGMPDDEQGWEFVTEKDIDTYTGYSKEWLQEGAQIIGGCCGTGPAYIESLLKAL